MRVLLLKVILKTTVFSFYEDKVKRAVDLSLEKYCGVAAMLRKHCAIHAKVIIE
jgi:putative redox protein